MDKGSLAPLPTLTALGGGTIKEMPGKKSKKDPDLTRLSKSAGSQFINMAVNMTWQLAAVVLLPIFLGVKISHATHSGNLFIFFGLGVALIGSIAVMWRAMQAANKVPVPKLTDTQRRAIRKSYEDEDKEE